MGSREQRHQETLVQNARPEMDKKNRRSLLLALILLLVALGVVLAKNRDFWFGVDEASDVEEAAPAPVANRAAKAVPAQAPAVSAATNPRPAIRKKNQVAAKSSEEPAATPVVTATRTEIPPMEVEVVAGETHRAVHPGSNAVLVEMPTRAEAQAAGVKKFNWSPVTNAAELTPMASGQAVQDAAYPALARQMKVQGSVLLQAFVGTDGGIRDLRVLSGNPILVSAAMEAARQWRFTPYMQNGRPVETQAKITVNLSIKIL
jgi:TonB family protein